MLSLYRTGKRQGISLEGKKGDADLIILELEGQVSTRKKVLPTLNFMAGI